jgi:hypothetical protein
MRGIETGLPCLVPTTQDFALIVSARSRSVHLI